MVALILGMLLCVALALAVVALVAIPARRDGRDILTPKGEEVVTALKERQGSTRQRREGSDEADDHTGPDGVEATAPAQAADAPVSAADAGTRA